MVNGASCSGTRFTMQGARGSRPNHDGTAACAAARAERAFASTSPEEEGFARMQIAFYASTPSYRAVMELHGWGETAEKLSGFAAKGEWAEMPMLITDEMLGEFCLVTEEAKLADELRKRYEGIADRLTLYTPFVPGEKNEWWRELSSKFGN